MIISKRIVAGSKDRIDLLRFMFQDYEYITEEIPTFPTKPCIYAGPIENMEQVVNVYEEAKLDYIIIGKYSAINLDSRIMLLNIIFDKYNRFVPKYLTNILEDIDEDIFIEQCKIYWVTGKWYIKELDNENSFLDFINNINMSKRDMMESYFNVVANTRPYRIESSFLTFLLRVKDQDFKNISFNYVNKVKSFNGKKYQQAIDGINKSLDSNIDNYELRLLNMIMNIVKKS